MALFPFAAAAVSAVFCWMLLRGFMSRGRPNLLAWAVALAMFGVASAAAGAGLAWGWSPGLYRLYYLFGAILNVPVLALGTVYLLAPRRAAHVCAAAVAAACVAAAVVVWGSELRAAGLSAEGIPRGREVMPEAARLLSRLYSIGGFLVVVGGALWSAARLYRGRQPHLRRLAGANLLIALGTTVVAAASEVARVAAGALQGALFAVGLFLGISIMFAGFLRTSAPRRA